MPDVYIDNIPTYNQVMYTPRYGTGDPGEQLRSTIHLSSIEGSPLIFYSEDFEYLTDSSVYPYTNIVFDYNTTVRFFDFYYRYQEATESYEYEPVDSLPGLFEDIKSDINAYIEDAIGTSDFKLRNVTMVTMLGTQAAIAERTTVDGKTYIRHTVTMRYYTFPDNLTGDNYTQYQRELTADVWLRYEIEESLLFNNSQWFDVYIENAVGSINTLRERAEVEDYRTVFSPSIRLSKEEVSQQYNIPIDQIQVDEVAFELTDQTILAVVEVANHFHAMLPTTVYGDRHLISNIDLPITGFYWDADRYFRDTIYLSGYANVSIATSDHTSESIRLTINASAPGIPGEPTHTPADMQALWDLLNSIPNININVLGGRERWSSSDTNPQTINNVIVTDNETPTGEGVTIVGTGTDAPDPLQGFTVEYTTTTIQTPSDKIENEGSAVIIQPGGDININAGGSGVILEGPVPTEPNHVVTKKYVDDNAPIHLTINNMVEAPFMELAGFYQDNVRTAVERVLQETDGVSIHQFALESDFINTTLETMTLNELVELLTHVAIVGR